jgi:hypothetical protein
MKNNSRKTPRKPILLDCELVPITDPAEQAALDRRWRAAEKSIASVRATTQKHKPLAAPKSGPDPIS